MGSRRGSTVTFVSKREDTAVSTVRQHLARGTTVYADEANHWDVLHARFKTKRINHSEAYSANGASTNMAESYFSRLRRAEIGTHHHIAGPYLAAYAAEMDWREEPRRGSDRAQDPGIPKTGAQPPGGQRWKGYLAGGAWKPTN